MEINSAKQPELTALIEKQFKGQTSIFDVRPDKDHLTVAESLNRANTKDINYQDLQPQKVYALRTTTTDLQSGNQETGFSLFLDRKMAESHFFIQTPKDNLIMKHQVQHGIIIEGEVDPKLLAKLQMAPSGFNEMMMVSSLQDHFDYSGTHKRQVEQASEIAKQIFNEISLKNENAYDIRPKGAQQDLYKYYEMTHGENRQITHVDAYAIQEKKEAIQINEPYTYIGLIHSKDHSTPSVAYTNEHDYLNAIEQGLKNNPQNLGYETISENPQLHKQVEDLVFKSYGLTNPYPIEYYTEQGRTPLSLQESNNPQISIMDLAKEMGFTYRNTNQEGDTIMQKTIQPNKNTPQITQIDLIIKNADNPLTNIVTVEYSRFNDSKSLTQDANFNPIAQDAEFHLPFQDFVALTKSLNSEEILKGMEQKQAETKSYNWTNPFPIENHTQQMREPSYIERNNHPEITIKDFAKELGFDYKGLTPDGFAILNKEIQTKEDGQQQTTKVSLEIKDPDNSKTNYVNVNYSYLDGNRELIVKDKDFHLSFNDFVNLTKTLNSEEILKGMEQKQTVDNSRSHTTIVDLAKELGFSYEGKDSLLGDVVMRYKYDYDNKENGQKETANIALSIKNPEDPQKNTVNVITTFFDANNKTIGTYYDNNQTFDQFVNITKSIGSKEVLEKLQNNNELNMHNTIPSENRIVIDHYHNTELFPLIDKQFNKISPAPLIDAYEIGLINESKLSVLPLYDKGQIELTPGEPKQIDIKDLAPTKIHAYFEYTTNVSTLEQLPKYKLSLDENNERLHNSKEQLPQETVKHGVAIHGDFDNHFVNLTANGDQNQAVLIALASTMANDPYFKITEQTPFFVLDAISKGREQAEGLFHDLPLTNEYSTNIEPKGTNKDLLQYYKLTSGEEPQLFHINSTEVDDYKNKVQREIHMGQEHPEDKYTKLNYTPLLDQSFIEKTFSALIIKNADEEKNTVNRQIYDLTNDLVQPIIKTDPLNSKIAAQALINYAKEHPENEYARQIIENHELLKSKTQPLEKTNIEVDLKKDFQYETASVHRKDNLLYDLQNKYKLDFDTVAKFSTFMEAAHPINRYHNDNSADIVVFPYVKTNNEYNLNGHLQSTMSGQRELLGKKLTNYTNIPIGYEHYTDGQKIPITHHTNTAAIEGGTWMATTAKNPEDVKTVHIYNSAIDAMSSYELHKIKPELENTAFISVGTMAHNSQIRGIKELFPNATIYLNFQNNIMGELSTIKSVAVLADNPVNIKTDGKNIDFKLSDGLEFKLNAGMTNYKNFEKMSGINHLDIPNLIVLPPAKGITWNDTLKQQNTQRQDEKQEHHRGMKL